MHAFVFNAVGPFDNERQRRGGHRLSLSIAKQGGDVNRLARTIDTTLGEDQRIEGTRCHAAFDAPVGQIERRRFEVEEAIIALAILSDNEAWRGPSAAARETGIEMNVAGIVGTLRCQNLIVAGIRRTSTPATGAALASERKNTWTPSLPLNAVRPKSETINHCVARVPPLSCILIIRGRPIAGPCGHHVNTRIDFSGRLHDREGGRHLRIEFGADVERAGPDFLSIGIDILLDLVGRELGKKLL